MPVFLLTALALAATPWLARAADEGLPAQARPAVATAARPSLRVVGADGYGRATSPPQEATRNDSYCLTCHGKPALRMRLADGHALSLYVDARALRDSAHGLLGCLTCHPGDTYPHEKAPPRTSAGYQAEAAELCAGCHLVGAGDYAASAHGAPVLSAGGDGATCNDCHSPDGSGHSTARIAGVTSPRYAEAVAESCGGCHQEELDSYNRTAHSELVRFGDRERAATCTNCHGDHAVVAVDDPGRPLAPARLARACAQCHEGADEDFAGEWLGHEAAASASGLISYAGRGVVALMALGVAFGLSHVALDVLRSPRRRGGGRR